MFIETPIDKIIEKSEYVFFGWFNDLDDPISRLLLFPFCFICLFIGLPVVLTLSVLNCIMYNK